MKNKAELKKTVAERVEMLVAQRKRWLRDAEDSKVLIDFVNLLPTFPEQFRLGHVNDESITLKFRYHKFLIAKLKKSMLKKGFQIEFEIKEFDITNNYSNPLIRFRKPKEPYQKFLIILEFDEDLVGSTCTRKQIGTTMKEVPVYKWSK